MQEKQLTKRTSKQDTKWDKRTSRNTMKRSYASMGKYELQGVKQIPTIS